MYYCNTMLQTTTLTQKWQMTLPKEIREFLGFKKPGPVLLELVDKKNKLIRIEKKQSFLNLAASLPAKNKSGKRLNPVKIRAEMEKSYTRV